MPVVTFIFGLCGAGKSEAAKELASKGSEILDEGSAFSVPLGEFISPAKYAKLQEYLKAGKDCAVVEASLYVESFRQEALDYLKGIPDVEVRWIGFENDPDTANHNCTHRKNKGDPEGHVRLNNRWTKNPYTFPDGAERRPIYKLPVPE
jgi:hypothetical protein